MDSKEEVALLVHMPNKIVKFKQFSNGLYAMDPNDEKSFKMTKKPYQFLNTLEENLLILPARLSSPACRLHVVGRAIRVRTLATRLITQSLTNHCSLVIT
jgi:hypothetical protein